MALEKDGAYTYLFRMGMRVSYILGKEDIPYIITGSVNNQTRMSDCRDLDIIISCEEGCEHNVESLFKAYDFKTEFLPKTAGYLDKRTAFAVLRLSNLDLLGHIDIIFL